MKHKGIPITVIEEFGHKYVTSMPASEFAFDELYEWVYKEFDKSSTQGSCSYVTVVCFSYGTNQLQLKRYTRMIRKLHVCHTHLKLQRNVRTRKICNLRVLSCTC